MGPKLPKNVSRYDGYLVARIERGDIQRTCRFRYRDGSQADISRAAKEAAAWIEAQKLNLPAAKNRLASLREKPLSGKQSGEPVGVSKTIAKSKNPAAEGSLRFMVNWKDSTGKGRVKSFVAGQIDLISKAQVSQARKAARSFRAKYEQATALGLPFDDAEFDNWRDRYW